MKEDALKRALKSAFAEAEPDNVPPFGAMFDSAEARLRVRRKRSQLGLVAAALVAVAAGFLLWPSLQGGLDEVPADDLLIAEALMNSTSWQAPSDVLLPDRQFDIYQDMPFEDVSTNLQEGPLL